MANLLQLNGSQGYKPTRYAPIWVNRFFQGLWTNRSPLRDAGSSRMEEKYYGQRGDALIAGVNVELTQRLTLARRPGHSVYNTNSFPAIKSFYSFKYHNTASITSEFIKVIADTPSTVYDATAGTHTALFSKAAGAGNTTFLSLGNTLYLTDGVDAKKWLVSPTIWQASTALTGRFQVDGVTLTNSNAAYITDANNNIQQVSVTGTTGAVQPTWPTAYGATTTDGTVTWQCMGSAIKNWGIATPATAPTTAIPASSGCKMWTPGAAITTPYFLFDGNGNAQIALGPGTTGTVYPSWNSSVGGQTTDGSVVWFNTGNPGSWAASQNFPSYASILDPSGNLQVAGKANGTQIGASDVTGYGTVNGGAGGSSTYTFVVIAYFADGTHTGTGNPIVINGTHFNLYWNPVPNVDHYKIFCTNIVGTAGTVTGTGAIHGTGSRNTGTGPTFAANINVYYMDNGAWFTVAGDGTTAPTNNTQSVTGTYQESGTAIPTFSSTLGGTTTDGNGTQPSVTWNCYGAAQTCVFTGYEWVYCYHSVNGHVSTASPAVQTGPVIGANYVATITGAGSGDDQVDAVWIFRTADGGASYLFAGSVTNPGSGQTWRFSDNVADDNLNEFQSAPIADANDPVPTGAVAPAYHLGRVFVAVDNIVYYSQSYNVVGVSSESFPPANNFQLPARVTRMVATSIGLMVYTVSDIWLIFGLGTSSSALQVMPYQQSIGLSNYNALDVDGGTHFFLSTDNQFLAMTPSVSGTQRLGFPIGDVLINGYDPTTAYVSHHVAGTMDDAIYLTNSTGWYRCVPSIPPDNSLSWSTQAQVTGGCAAVQSIEVTPGVHKLLVSPAAGGPILQRDLTTYSDNGTAYVANCTFGSLVLVQPGQMAELDHITLESVRVGTAPTVGVILDEALPYYTGAFTNLTSYVNEPPQLPVSTSLLAQRFYFGQANTPAWCRHLQIKVSWIAEAQANELLGISIFGAHWQGK